MDKVVNGVSVLIKGMEMPKNCLTCPCSDSEYGECVLDPEKRCPEDYKQRAEWCLLVPVPPHGDLIGREWLIDIALHLLHTANNDEIANGVKWLLQYIIDAPTIIPAEEGE